MNLSTLEILPPINIFLFKYFSLSPSKLRKIIIELKGLIALFSFLEIYLGVPIIEKPRLSFSKSFLILKSPKLLLYILLFII